MGNIYDFSIELKKQLHRVIPEEMREDLTIDEIEVVKINDEKLHGLTFKTKGVDAAPTMYLENYYHDYMNGFKSAADIAEELFDTYQFSTQVDHMPQTEKLNFDFDAIKDKLSLRVLDPRKNEAFLADKPYVVLDGGLAAIMDINPAAEYRVAVNDGVLESIGVEKEVLFEAALESMQHIDRPMLVDMSAALFSPVKDNLLDMDGSIDPEELGGMYVFTSDSGSCGAAYVANPDLLDRAAEVIGKNCFVLPSSLHEVILVPDTGNMDVSDLHRMVEEANRTVVMQCDILSDDVFYYDLHEHSFMNLTSDVERKAEEEADAVYDDDLDM